MHSVIEHQSEFSAHSNDPNKAYWSNFYSNSKELPFEPSGFSLYALHFLRSRLEKNRNFISLIWAAEMEETHIIFLLRATKSQA